MPSQKKGELGYGINSKMDSRNKNLQISKTAQPITYFQIAGEAGL
jgi:hypothetical protein